MAMLQTVVGVPRLGATAVPPALAHELARPGLVEHLARRWTVPVTCVVAGAGFGKSTILAQAVRAETAAPRGVDVWVSCDARHESADELARAVVDALHGDINPDTDPLVAGIEALRALAPLDVCLVLDDVHLLGDDTSGAHLLTDVVARLPANAHLVLAGRRLPPVPLARLRAAERVVDIGEADLTFSPTEVERLAARLGRPAHVARPFGGWPALVRVSLATRPGVAHGFVREEVLAALCPEARRTLLALAVVGTADAELVGRITGTVADLDRLADRVPLVSRADERRYRAHDLWGDALRRVLEPDLTREVECRAVDALLAVGDVVRAGDVAIRAADWHALGRAALELVRTTISVLPTELAARWLAALPSADRMARSPELRLLAAALRAAEDFGDRSVDDTLDAVAGAFRARHDPGAEVVALAVATVAAQSRGDTDRLVALALRTADVPGGGDLPIVRLAACSIAGVLAEMSGDPEAAVEHFLPAPLDDVPPALAVSANRFLMHCLLLAGRADEAVALTDRALDAVGSTHCQAMPAFARWLAGDPTAFAQPARLQGYGAEDASDRDAFVAAAFTTVIGASWGERTPLDNRHRTPANGRDAAVVANARAALAVLDHDEASAAAIFAAVREQHGDDRLCERHLRRFLALGYVIDPVLRARWDGAALGPTHERARQVARLLVGLRHGRAPAGPTLDLPLAFTVLLLPWSIELACRLHAVGSRDGAALAAWLLDRVGCRAHDELRLAVASTDRRVAAGAAALLARVPKAPARSVEIGVLGPLVVRHGDIQTTGGDLRRQRVRELLAILVLEETVARDRIIDALWPDHDVEAGARNLRVTLTYLRRLLEPDRPAGEASFHVRADAATIRLVPTPYLRVDLWEQQRLTAEAGEARAAGGVERAVELLAEATALWRGSPLTDLDRVAGFEAEVERIRLVQTTSLLDLGGLLLTTGDAAGALAVAERALAIEPYLEAAHRLAIASSSLRGDPARILGAVGRATQALADLGVTPEPETAMLLRAATRGRAAVALAS